MESQSMGRWTLAIMSCRVLIVGGNDGEKVICHLLNGDGHSFFSINPRY
jgi:hypothetical protein